MTELSQLLDVSLDDRDLNWEENFFMAFTESRVKLLSEEPQAGPDGWPYLLAETATTGDGESVQQIFHWLATRGIGLAINPQKSYPDFVFTYGMIWHFRQTGLFYRKQSDVINGSVTLQKDQGLRVGEPAEEYLPSSVRKVLRDFFRDQMVLMPKILMISENGEHFDLAFSLESLGNPPASEHQGLAEAIGWFLPPHYSILLAPQGNMPFVDL